MMVAAVAALLATLRGSQSFSHELLPPPAHATLASTVDDNRQLVKLDGPGELAACLDGSP